MNNFPVFYHPNIQDPFLSEEEAFHAIKVLRLSLNSSIFIIDGKGGKWLAKIKDITKKNVSIEILESEKNFQAKPLIHLVIAPTKQMDRMEWLTEKCTEIGIASIQFIKTFHSERREIKLDRLNKIAISAIKQSKQLFLPEILPIINFDDFLKNISIDNDKNFLFGSLIPGQNKTYKDIDNINNETYFLIGPEGDFSQDELDKLLKMNWLPISLGNTILRTETAGLVGLIQISTLQNQKLD